MKIEDAVCEVRRVLEDNKGRQFPFLTKSEEFAIRTLLDGYREAAASKTCDGCMEKGKWENELEYGYHCPCIRCVRQCHDNYMRGPEPGGEEA